MDDQKKKKNKGENLFCFSLFLSRYIIYFFGASDKDRRAILLPSVFHSSIKMGRRGEVRRRGEKLRERERVVTSASNCFDYIKWHQWAH